MAAGRSRREARSTGTAVETDMPSGRSMLTIASRTRMETSSAFGTRASPWPDDRASTSVKVWGLVRPRGGPIAVTTTIWSPMEGSVM